ncbi:GNAT family N-acetyltransferase [Variovorax paradoxus]|nr:GNAT family N-acetyltransferase [Variovorax paradoxus]
MNGDFPELRTSRLRLRAWRAEDLTPFAELNADPEVSEHLLGPITRAMSDSLVERIARHFEREGFGLWAVEAPSVANFIGMVGISVPGFTAPFTPCVEVGWRLARRFWGHGFASEAAQAALAFGFENVGLVEIVAMTVPDNTRSQAVMLRLGMTRDPADDFEHPLVPAGHRLAQHVLYRLSKDA